MTGTRSRHLSTGFPTAVDTVQATPRVAPSDKHERVSDLTLACGQPPVGAPGDGDQTVRRSHRRPGSVRTVVIRIDDRWTTAVIDVDIVGTLGARLSPSLGIRLTCGRPPAFVHPWPHRSRTARWALSPATSPLVHSIHRPYDDDGTLQGSRRPSTGRCGHLPAPRPLDRQRPRGTVGNDDVGITLTAVK